MDRSIKGLVWIFEVTVRVAAVFLVKKEQIEIRFIVIVLAYPLPVSVNLPEEQPLTVSRPQIEKQMAVGQPCAQIKCSDQIAFDGYVAIKIGLADSLLVERAERANAALVVYRNSECDPSVAYA
jgi:hypothetical protein